MVAYKIESGNQNEEILGNTESEAVSVFLKNCSCRNNVNLGAIIQVGTMYFNTRSVAKLHGYSLTQSENNKIGHLRISAQ